MAVHVTFWVEVTDAGVQTRLVVLANCTGLTFSVTCALDARTFALPA